MAAATQGPTLEKPEVAHVNPDVVTATQDRIDIASATRTASPGFVQLVKNKRVLGYCLLIFILPINFGYELALVGNILAIPGFLDRYSVSIASGREIPAHDQQVLNASTNVGIFIAAFTTGFISDMIGRRKVIFLGCALCIVGIFVQAWSTSIMMLFGGKLISTLGYGMGHPLSPVFVAEIAPNELRGLCLILVNSMVVIGQWMCALVGYAGTFIVGDWGWRMPVLVQIAPPAAMLVLAIPLLPESPSWLLVHGKREAAGESLRKFNGPSHDVKATLALLEATVEKERQLNSEGASYFFTLAGVQNAVGVAQACYTVQLFGNICSWFLIDRSGRRPLIVWGCIAMTILLLVIGYLGIARDNKQKTYSINVMSNTAAACLVGQIVPILINSGNANLGAKVAFVFFGPSLLFSVYLYLCFPEMKGRSCLELEEMFQKNVPTKDFTSYSCVVDLVDVDGEKPVVVLRD
ncbi:maltose permease [Diaporthe sp. PMI_573]|nr:maltose permease [Diaporthaceae sp. PMI_573]